MMDFILEAWVSANIERAKGALMARFGLTEDEAFKRLRRAAMDSRRPMVDVARALLVSENILT